MFSSFVIYQKHKPNSIESFPLGGNEGGPSDRFAQDDDEAEEAEKGETGEEGDDGADAGAMGCLGGYLVDDGYAIDTDDTDGIVQDLVAILHDLVGEVDGVAKAVEGAIVLYVHAVVVVLYFE